MSSGTGRPDDPWILATPSGGSAYTMWRDDDVEPPLLVARLDRMQRTYLARAVDDLHAYLVERDDWVPLGACDEQRPPVEGTVEAWARSESNPVGGWYGQEVGSRGRFALYVPPLLVHQGRAEISIENRRSRIRAC